MNTEAYDNFSDSLGKIRAKISRDTFLNQLLFANVITAFEVFLQSVALGLMSYDASLIRKVTETNRFKNQKVSLTAALTNDMKKYVKSLVMNIVFHNLSEIEPLFKEAWNVKIPITQEILASIRVRHDIIHRNGYTKEKLFHEVDEALVIKVADVFEHAAKDVDKQVCQLYGDMKADVKAAR